LIILNDGHTETKISEKHGLIKQFYKIRNYAKMGI